MDPLGFALGFAAVWCLYAYAQGRPMSEPIRDRDPGDETPLRIPESTAPVRILNGCPRCGGPAILRRKDKARHCKACDRTFYLFDDATLTEAA